jgi:hypothetical protein
VQLKPSCGRRGVNPFGQRYEGHAGGLKLVEEQNQVTQATSEAVETPTDQDIELPTLRSLE